MLTHAENVVVAAGGYFRATGLIYAFAAISMMSFSAYQGRGRATVPLLTSLLRVAVVLVGGWVILRWQGARLDWLYYLVAVSVILSTTTLAAIFALRPPGTVRKAVYG